MNGKGPEGWRNARHVGEADERPCSSRKASRFKHIGRTLDERSTEKCPYVPMYRWHPHTRCIPVFLPFKLVRNDPHMRCTPTLEVILGASYLRVLQYLRRAPLRSARWPRTDPSPGCRRPTGGRASPGSRSARCSSGLSAGKMCVRAMYSLNVFHSHVIFSNIQLLLQNQKKKKKKKKGFGRLT